MGYKIGLVGAPLSGKTKLANELQDALVKEDGRCQECITPIKIIDGYIDRISDRSDVAFGLFGNYIGNTQIAIGRWEEERYAAKSNKTIITCGTMIETTTYCALNAFSLTKDEDDFEERRAMDARAGQVMGFFGMFWVDTNDYDFLFHLPFPKYLVDDDKHLWEQRVDEQIPSAAQALEAKLIELPEKDQVDFIIQQINLKDGRQNVSKDIKHITPKAPAPIE